MSTPEGHSNPAKPDISHLWSELTDRVNASQQETAQAADTLPSVDLSGIASALLSAAVRTEADHLLYRSPDAPAIEPDAVVTPVVQIRTTHTDPGTALNQSEALSAIMADFQGLNNGQSS